MLTLYLTLILLTTLYAFDPVRSQNCSKDGKSYLNVDTTRHENGCTWLQCQLGTFDRLFESCGRELDGSCHSVNHMFPYQNATYICQKVQVGQDIQYQYQVVTPRSQESCVDGGQTYQSLEKFRRGEGCREYQCQNGVVVPLESVCGKEIDGKCHVVGEIFEKEGTAYICTNRSQGDTVVFENVVLVPQPVSKRVCPTMNNTYQNYDTFRQLPICNLRQCRDRTINILTNECAFKREDVKCYKVGEQWRLDDRTYVCAINESTQQATTEILVRGQSRCYRSGRWYKHLEIVFIGRCNVYQCQDGQLLPVSLACLWKEDNQCHPLKSLWYDNNGLFFKCVLDGDDQLSVVLFQAPAPGK